MAVADLAAQASGDASALEQFTGWISDWAPDLAPDWAPGWFAGPLNRITADMTALDAALALAAAALGAGLAYLMIRAVADGFGAGATTTPPGAAAFRLEGDQAFPENRAARRLLGGAGPAPCARILARFAEGDLEHARSPAAAFAALEEGGASFNMLIEDRDGVLWEAVGAPENGMARVTLGKAGRARRDLARAGARIAALKAERDRLRATLDAIPAMAWRRDADGRLTWANLPYLALTGTTAADPHPRELQRGDAPGDPGRNGDRGPGRGDDRGAMRDAASGKAQPPGVSELTDGRHSFFDANTGQRRWFDLRAMQDGDGVIGFAVDAAPVVEAEASLRRFVETLTGTFAHLRIGLAIFDNERRLGLFNPAFGELMKLDPAWLASRPALGDVLTRLRESRMLPDQADFAAWRRELMSLFDDPAAADYADVWSLPGERSIRVIARPHPQGALAFLFEDVSEIARLERRYLTEVQMRRATMDRLDEAVAAFGPNGQAQFANPAFARVWGFRPGEDGAPNRLTEALARFRALSLPQPADSDPWTRLEDFMIREDRRTAFTQQVNLSDGRSLQARFAPLPDGSILTAFTDITAAERVAAALRERNDALEAADEIRTRLITQLSEHLRRPMSAIIGFSRMLGARGGGEDALSARQLSYVNGIVKSAGEISDAMLGAADIASDPTAALELESGPQTPPTSLAAVLERVGEAAAERDVILTLQCNDREAAAAVGGGVRTRRILFSLLTDAVQHCPRGGLVLTGCARRGESLEIWVTQPGDPVSAQGLRRGIAHELARRLAERRNGDIDIVAETVGEDEDPASGDRRGRRMRVVCSLPHWAVGAAPETDAARISLAAPERRA